MYLFPVFGDSNWALQISDNNLVTQFSINIQLDRLSI